MAPSLKMTPISTAVNRIPVLQYSTLCVRVPFCATVLEAEIGSLNKTNASLRESLRVSEARMSVALKELESSRRERGFGERELERYRVKTALQHQNLQLPTAAAADELTTPRSRAPSTGACSTTSTRRSLSFDRATLQPHTRRSPTIAETDELLFVPSGGGRRADSSEHILRRKLEDALRTRDDLK